MSNQNNIEAILKEVLENQKTTNKLLEKLIHLFSVSIDLATGEDVLNKDFLEDEVRKGFFTG